MRRSSLHRRPYPVYLKASPFCPIQSSWARRRCHPLAAGAATPTPSDAAAPTGIAPSSSIPLSAAMGLLSLRPRRNPYSACRRWQRRRLLVSFSFLEALPWPLVAPLFELGGNTRSGSSGPDGDDISTLSSFLKALSCSLAVSPELDLAMLELLLVWCCRSWFGLDRFSCVVHASLRLCHVLYTPACVCIMCCTHRCTHSIPLINEMIRKLCVFTKRKTLKGVVLCCTCFI